jgi:mannose-6-phosphate isomerase-like protein (cupin superfamily)
MSKYIFTEDEWLDWSDEYTSATLVGIHGEHYDQLNHVSLKNPPAGIETYDRFIGVNTFAPGGVYESHPHETSMFYYVLKGTAKMRVGDEERIVGKGAWVFTPAGLPHYTENVGDDDMAYILFGGNPKDPDSKAHTAVAPRRPA